MKHNRILIVLTSNGQLGQSGKKTGFHYEELTTPYYLFRDAGHEVVLASVDGGEPPHDPGSLKEPVEDNAPSVVRFLNDEHATGALKNTRSVIQIGEQGVDEFDAIYLPGGHGTMWDMPENEHLASIVSTFFQENKPVSAVCHGIAGFIGARDTEGNPMVKGRKINCFTNAEEKAVELDRTVPFLLESRVRELGADFESSANFHAHVARDGNLITGQNPASAEGVAQAVLDYLGQPGEPA